MARSIDYVNNLSFEQFREEICTAFYCPAVMNGLWSFRPFRDIQHLYQHISLIMDRLPWEVQEGVLRVTPDLAGRKADQNTLSKESTSEQRQCGLFNLTPKETAYMRAFNKYYKQKFGFPFVICAREHTKKSIMREIRERCVNDKEEELNNGLSEMKKIIFLRLTDIIRKEHRSMNRVMVASRL